MTKIKFIRLPFAIWTLIWLGNRTTEIKVNSEIFLFGFTIVCFPPAIYRQDIGVLFCLSQKRIILDSVLDAEIKKENSTFFYLQLFSFLPTFSILPLFLLPTLLFLSPLPSVPFSD